MKRYGKAIFIFFAAAVIGAGAVWLAGKRGAELDRLARPAAPVYAVYLDRAETGRLEVTRSYLGTIQAVAHAVVAFRMTGHLLSAPGEPGDDFSAGDVLAQIDQRPFAMNREALAAELEGARSELDRSEMQLERRKPLLAKGLIDPEAVDTSETAFRTARARVDSLEARLASADIDVTFSSVYAPFDGVITDRHKRAGDLVMPGEPVYTIENPDSGYAVIIRIPRETALLAAPGRKAMVSFNGRRMETTLYRVYPATHEGRLATAEFRLDQRPFGLPSGAFVTVDLLVDEVEGIRVSARTLLEDETGARIFRVEAGGRVDVVGVTVLAREKEKAVIAGPVSEGDRLVVAEESMLLQLTPGSRVRPVEPFNGGGERR